MKYIATEQTEKNNYLIAFSHFDIQNQKTMYVSKNVIIDKEFETEDEIKKEFIDIILNTEIEEITEKEITSEVLINSRNKVKDSSGLGIADSMIVSNDIYNKYKKIIDGYKFNILIDDSFGKSIVFYKKNNMNQPGIYLFMNKNLYKIEKMFLEKNFFKVRIEN